MNNPPLCGRPRRNRGVALVLVLCFVVLLTGLVVAYFSRALTTRQLSNASTSTTQAEMLANSATDVILSDLKVEIANGSIISAPPPAALPAGSTLYLPTQAANAVPQRNISPAATPAVAPAPAVGPVPNLVRRSLHLDSVGGINAVPAPASTSRASAANSATASVNGRFVTPARWNRHYLIPTATPAPGGTPAGPSNPVPDFTAPDWVFVTAEKGPDVLSSPTKDAVSSIVTVTGRYAYAIYDEGGLLDINHTGYPSASTVSHIGAKPAPSYADLRQLPPPSASSAALTSLNVDNLLGWRNFATLQTTGTFPALQPSATLSDAAYYTLFTSNPIAPASNAPSLPPPSLLQVPFTTWNNLTDQMFLSRQQLIGYFAAAGLDPRYLQYLGTFSRGLNQPSYLPEHSTTSLSAARPAVLDPASGGNDSARNLSITPNFLTARVVNPFQRYDKTTALVGEPLVKKRFPLDRLAWLTYKGPSAARNTSTPATTTTGADADIGALKQNGISKEWLDQGTDANIATYFGLKWDAANKWTYIHGSNGSNGAILNIRNTAKPLDVVRLTGTAAREPDFFELLKATINPGSIAKASFSPGVLDPSTHANPNRIHAAQNQYNLDISLDTAILQIGANIIDQFDTDGFPTQIHYDLLASGFTSDLLPAVYGDENVPYITRVRSGLIHVVESKPASTDSGVDASGVQKPVGDTGVGALMNYPEIWNLHDWSATNVPQSVGAIAPGNFKIFAQTNTNNGLNQPTTVYVWDNYVLNGNTYHHNSMDADVANSPGFSSLYHFPFGLPAQTNPQGGEARYLSESNTKMTFSIDPTSAASEILFREPTILYKPGFPKGSNLASPTLVASNGGTPAGLGDLALNPGFFNSVSGGGLVSAVSGTNTSYSPLIPALGTAYVGFYIGAHPLRWWDDNGDSTHPQNGKDCPVYQTQFGPVNDVIYTLACEDGIGGWIPYDAKSVTTTGQPNAILSTSVDAGFGFNGTGENQLLDFGVRFYQTVDPRTSRFGMVDPWIQSNANSIPPRQGYSAIDMNQGTIKTDREGLDSGTALFVFGMSGDPYAVNDWLSPATGWYHSGSLYSAPWPYRPGLLSQNNPTVTPDANIAGSTVLLPINSNPGGILPPLYYADADGVVRRASGGNVPPGTNVPASSPPAPNKLLLGLPMAYATGTLNTAYSSGTVARQMDSRPSILNRPFRSVAELGYVYSGTPWKNLDFFLPESGDSALLDVFCVNDNSDANALTAGQVNLNTHQVPVLQAILAQTSKDQWNDANTIPGISSGTMAQLIAQLLVTRTTTGPTSSNGPQPLQNISDLVGRWVKEVDLPAVAGGSGNGGINGQASYDGFAADLATLTASGDTSPSVTNATMHSIQRFGESAVRALSNSGQTRVWNLMFDLVAQTGRFAPQAASLDQFNVEGEQHYWVHVAIDRYTGQVLDKQVEVVKE